MKTHHLLPLVLALSAPWLLADSKRTAEHVLATPSDYAGKEITLDVAFVKPVQWKSPVPELAFFYALTIDRSDDRPGGHLLVAIPASEAGAFAKKYGMDFDGRNDRDTLRGVFLAAPGREEKRRIWFVDTTGQAFELIKAKKLELVDDGGPMGGGRPPRRDRP